MWCRQSSACPGYPDDCAGPHPRTGPNRLADGAVDGRRKGSRSSGHSLSRQALAHRIRVARRTEQPTSAPSLPSGRGAGNSDTLLPDAQGKVTVVYTAPTRLSVQADATRIRAAIFGVGRLARLPSPGGFSVNAAGGGGWSLHQSPGPAAAILAQAETGKLPRLERCSPTPLLAVVTDAYGNYGCRSAGYVGGKLGRGSLSPINTTTDGSGRSKVLGPWGRLRATRP
jgi:hypothetical protein